MLKKYTNFLRNAKKGKTSQKKSKNAKVEIYKTCKTFLINFRIVENILFLIIG
jgi:hypothetical protein